MGPKERRNKIKAQTKNQLYQKKGKISCGKFNAISEINFILCVFIYGFFCAVLFSFSLSSIVPHHLFTLDVVVVVVAVHLSRHPKKNLITSCVFKSF